METCQCYYSPLVHQAKAVASSSSYASQRSSLTAHLSTLTAHPKLSLWDRGTSEAEGVDKFAHRSLQYSVLSSATFGVVSCSSDVYGFAPWFRSQFVHKWG